MIIMVSRILGYLKNQFKMSCHLLENNWTSMLKGIGYVTALYDLNEISGPPKYVFKMFIL